MWRVAAAVIFVSSAAAGAFAADANDDPQHGAMPFGEMREHQYTATGPPEQYRLTDRHGSQCARKISFLSPSVPNWRSELRLQPEGTTVLQIAL